MLTREPRYLRTALRNSRILRKAMSVAPTAKMMATASCAPRAAASRMFCASCLQVKGYVISLSLSICVYCLSNLVRRYCLTMFAFIYLNSRVLALVCCLLFLFYLLCSSEFSSFDFRIHDLGHSQSCRCRHQHRR